MCRWHERERMLQYIHKVQAGYYPRLEHGLESHLVTPSQKDISDVEREAADRSLLLHKNVIHENYGLSEQLLLNHLPGWRHVVVSFEGTCSTPELR